MFLKHIKTKTDKIKSLPVGLAALGRLRHLSALDLPMKPNSLLEQHITFYSSYLKYQKCNAERDPTEKSIHFKG